MRDRRRRVPRALAGLAILRERNVALFFGGYAVSFLGTAMSSVALAFAVLGSGGTAADLGLAMAALTLAQVVFMLAGGVVNDRLGPRRVMLAADLLRSWRRPLSQ